MILYLHGFRSGPQSAKVSELAARLAARQLPPLTCPQLPPVPDEAIACASALIEASPTPVTLVGSSLGGFYATWLAERYGLRAVLINPFVPHADFDPALFLGTQQMIYSGETFTFTAAHAAQIAALDRPHPRHPERLWLLAETGDETLDWKVAVARYAGARQTVLPGGDHSFSRWTDYLDAVITFAGVGA